MIMLGTKRQIYFILNVHKEWAFLKVQIPLLMMKKQPKPPTVHYYNFIKDFQNIRANIFI